jgi:hypothetical protein
LPFKCNLQRYTEAPHSGSVFFPLPDGTAILHALEVGLCTLNQVDP